MKTLIKAALILSAIGFATVANAQDATFAGAYSGTTIPSIDSIDVEFVTVGATMPYQTSSSAGNLVEWLENAQAYGLLTGGTAALSNKWLLGGTEITGAANMSAIKLTWDTEGRYVLTTNSSVVVNGTVVASCDAAVSGKTVYVLPVPKVDITSGDGAILGCDVTSHAIGWRATGIGQKQFRYTLSRQELGGGEDDAFDVVENGSAQSSTTWFRETGSMNFAYAEGFYDLGTAEGQVTGTITIPDLEPGYAYKLEITEISDQISRKGTGQDSDFKIVPTAADGKYVASFAVVPKPESTKIDHIKNVE